MKAFIKGISYYLPDRVITNEELVKDFPEWSMEKITTKIGINQRHIAAEDETAGDMAVKAAQNLFDEYSISPKEIDFLMLCTQSPDYFLPTTACILQERLNIPTSSGALDFNLGCSGYVYGLSLAKGLLFTGIAKNILLLTSETYNKHIHPKDIGNRSIFGDAAAATLISDSGFAEIGDFSLGTDGRGAENLIIHTGGFRHKSPKNDYINNENNTLFSSDHLYMNGSEVFNFTLEAVPPLVEDTLKKNNININDIDLVVFHQATKFMLETLRTVCGIEKDKFYYCMDTVGNTISSTIPIAIKDAQNKNEIVKEAKVLLAGFGVGYSWAGCVLWF